MEEESGGGMVNQYSIFDAGRDLKNEGIERAMNNAGRQWQDQAYSYLLDYIKENETFMVEDVRTSSQGIIPDPPSKRAWGGIVVRARKAKKIHRAGYAEVKNPKAHQTPATVWRVISYQ